MWKGKAIKRIKARKLYADYLKKSNIYVEVSKNPVRVNCEEFSDMLNAYQKWIEFITGKSIYEV